MAQHFLDKPRASFVLAFLITAGTAFAYVNGSLARLEKDSQNREALATRLIEQRNREVDDLKAWRLSAESQLRNCRP
jgi:hypothetical protein